MSEKKDSDQFAMLIHLYLDHGVHLFLIQVCYAKKYK